MPMPRASATAGLMAAAILAGCQMSGPGPGPSSGPIASQQRGVDGEWMSTDGVAMSRLTGGRFETVALDTGSVVANGSYRYVDSRTVQIEVTSLLRQTTSSVNCALIGPTQLNCTGSDGRQFVLVRRAAG